MDYQDFSRNFASSFFAVRGAWLKAYLSTEQKNTTGALLNDEDRVPVWRPEFTDKSTFRGRFILPSGLSPSGFIYDTLSGIPWHNDMDEEPHMITSTPLMGMVRPYMGLAFVTGAPIRGTPRGFCANNVETHVFTPELHDGVDAVVSGGLSMRAIWTLYNPVYTGLRDAFNGINEGESLGYALSRFLGVVLVPFKKYPVVVYKNAEVGSMRGVDLISMYDGIPPAAERYIRKLFPYLRITHK